MEAFFEREVKPHVPDAWIDTARRDEKDGQVGIVGYEINFNRYFYRYTPPRPLEEIEADIRAIETDIMRMLSEVTGGAPRPSLARAESRWKRPEEGRLLPEHRTIAAQSRRSFGG